MREDPALSDFVQAYVEAFAEQDIDRILIHWAFPATVSVGDVTTCFATPEAFAENLSALLGFYAAQGAARIKAELADAQLLMPTAAQLRVSYRLAKADDTPMTAWNHYYMARRIGGHWRFIFALADEEVDAWRQRGTPLG